MVSNEDKNYWLSRLILTKDETTGDIIATSPDFAELTSFGITEDEARHYARLALNEAIAARLADGAALPDGDRL